MLNLREEEKKMIIKKDLNTQVKRAIRNSLIFQNACVSRKNAKSYDFMKMYVTQLNNEGSNYLNIPATQDVDLMYDLLHDKIIPLFEGSVERNAAENLKCCRKPLLQDQQSVKGKDTLKTDMNNFYACFEEVNFPNGLTVLYQIRQMEKVGSTVEFDKADYEKYEDDATTDEERKDMLTSFVGNVIDAEKADYENRDIEIESYFVEIAILWSRK